MNTRPVRVMIDGLDVPCGGIFGGPSWALSTGVTAPEIVWRLDPAAADQVLSKSEVEIIFDYQGAPPLVIKRAVVVKETPTGSPFSRGVVLSDVRWYWSRKWVKRSFNVRMRTGTRRLVGGPDGIPIQALQQVDDLAYAKFSLKKETTAWDADDMVKEVLAQLAGSGFRNDARPRPKIKPNDVEVDDRGDHALARVLGSIGGGIDVRVDPDGTIVLFDRVLGSEKGMIEGAFGAPLLGLGMIRWIDTSHLLPSKVVNLFTRDMELRLDYAEEAANATTSQQDDSPVLDCVAQITDTTLQVTSGGVTSTEVQGTWVKFQDLLTAFNKSAVPFPKPVAGFSPPQQLDTSVLQDRYLGPAMFLQYVTQFGALPSMQWAGRIGSIMKSYRIDYRINRRFLGRIYPGSIRAVRVGLADAVTAMRHQSPVYMDYCERPTLRQLALNTEATLGWNVHCLPPTNAPQNLGTVGTKAYPAKILLKDCVTPAPASLAITDAQSGVISVQMRRDTWDQAETLIPSLVQDLPVVNPFKVATASALATWEQCSLAKNHRMITIVSVIPAGPNNEEQLHEVNVTLDDALARLGVSKGRAGKPGGSDIHQRIYPGLERARFAWDDSASSLILGAFSDSAKSFPTALTPVNSDILKDIAQTFTASLVATLLSHYEGAMAKEFDPSLVPIGSVHTVTHGVDGTGRALSTVNAEPRGPVIRPEALMSPATRRVVLGEGVSK